jgi:hypothetical protein
MPSEIDYINPESVRPKYGWQPSSGLAGMFYSRDRDRYEEMARMQDTRMGAATQLTLEDLVQGAPARQATRDATVRDLPVQSRGLEATTRGQELNTEFTEATQPGKIGLAQGEQDLARGQQGIAKAVQVIAQEPAGPDWAARVGTKIRDSGLKPGDPSIKILQGILDTGNPQEAQQRALQWLQLQSQTEPAYRQTMDSTRMRGEYDLKRQELANQGAVQAAQARTAAKNKSSVQILKEASGKGATEQVHAAMLVINDPDVDPQIKQMATALYNAALPAYQREQQRGIQPQISGFPQTPGIQMPQYGQQPGAAPQGGATHRFNPQTGKVEPIR